MGIKSVEGRALQDFTVRPDSAAVPGIQRNAKLCAWMYAEDLVHMEQRPGFISLFCCCLRGRSPGPTNLPGSFCKD